MNKDSSKSSSETNSTGATKSGSSTADTKSGSQSGSSTADTKSGSHSGSSTADTKSGSQSGSSTADTKSGSQSGSSTADTKSGSRNSQTTGNAATSATAAPPAEKRTEISSAIKQERVQEATNVNFNVSVGTTVPGNVHFYPLPSRIVEIYPEWRGYEFILVHGRYVIVRPQTHEIVYIIEG